MHLLIFFYLQTSDSDGCVDDYDNKWRIGESGKCPDDCNDCYCKSGGILTSTRKLCRSW